MSQILVIYYINPLVRNITSARSGKSPGAPEIKSSTSSTNILSSKNSSAKASMNKGLNVIPLKNLNSQRENQNALQSNYNTNSEKPKADRFSPRPKDLKISSNVSPRQKIAPSSTKNTGASDKVNFESKYTNKIYSNLTNNLMHKSPSPRPHDSTKNSKLSPDQKNK